MSRVPSLIAQGYEQVSRKRRTIARLPEGKTGLEALAAVDPTHVANLRTSMENHAAEFFRRIYAEHAGLTVVLTEEEFSEFLHETGRKAWR